MLHLVYEGTPVGNIPVVPFNAGSPVYWEAGCIGMLNTAGQGTVSDGSTGAFGILADRRSPYPGIAIANFLPAAPAAANGYGDESLFNQPGHGNALFGTTNSVNNIIPTNTIPTTTNLRDETAVNPNADTRLVTMYTRGGQYATDQYDTTQTYVPGTSLYVMQDGTGRLTNQRPGSNSILVGMVVNANNGYSFLEFKSLLV